ncbi:hypothetical protein QYF36_011866 [Acer negundo]|nr:hypothetical protein QYF36_011866 [Acer negundo]
MRMEKVAKWPEVSKAWNFDFDDDDDESDGADVASFNKVWNVDLDSNRPGTGFDDSDDVDSYDIDAPNK